jgi:hypothetical protein
MGVGSGSGEGVGSGAGGAETAIEFDDGIRAIRGSGWGDGGADIRPWEGLRPLFAIPFLTPRPVIEPPFRPSSPSVIG